MSAAVFALNTTNQPTSNQPKPQTGDVLNADGTGSFSAWDGIGGTFADENLAAFPHERGAVSMANSGPDTNSCQWFVTLVVRGIS